MSLCRASLVDLLPMPPLPSPTTRVTSWCLSGQSWPSYLSARSGGNSWSSSTWGLSTSTPWCSTLGLASSTSWAFTSTSTSWASSFWMPCSTMGQMGTEHSLIRWIVETWRSDCNSFQAPGLRLFNMQESQKVGTLGNRNQVGVRVLYLLMCHLFLQRNNVLASSYNHLGAASDWGPSLQAASLGPRAPGWKSLGENLCLTFFSPGLADGDGSPRSFNLPPTAPMGGGTQLFEEAHFRIMTNTLNWQRWQMCPLNPICLSICWNM